ncbi:MAG: DUF4845 domain-containing protein [Gammaproteobacteria bacterium]|nr:DUF4845 domain-containing protein [Gammaproteobacteria bacterium]
MRLRRSQLGLGMWGWFYVAGTMGVIAMVGIKSVPIYTNQMAIQRAIQQVAGQGALASASAPEVRSALQRFWDIEDIAMLDTKEVKVKKTAAGRSLAYEYEARVHLFYNIDIVMTFADEVPMRAGEGA